MRYLSKRAELEVRGYDLTLEYVNLGNELCELTGTSGKVKLMQGNALIFANPEELDPSQKTELNSYDAVYTIHVGMNIENKLAFFKSAFNLLKEPKGRFAIYDICSKINKSENVNELLQFPLPWTSDKRASFVEHKDIYLAHLETVGFRVLEAFYDEDLTFAMFSAARKKALEEGKVLISPINHNAKEAFFNYASMVLDRTILCPAFILCEKK